MLHQSGFEIEGKEVVDGVDGDYQDMIGCEDRTLAVKVQACAVTQELKQVCVILHPVLLLEVCLLRRVTPWSARRPISLKVVNASDRCDSASISSRRGIIPSTC